MELNLLLWLLERPLHLRLLLAAYYYEKFKGKPPYTRQLLRLVGGSSEVTRKVEALDNLARLNLIERYKDYEIIGKRKVPVVRNRVTELGKLVIKFIEQLDKGVVVQAPPQKLLAR